MRGMKIARPVLILTAGVVFFGARSPNTLFDEVGAETSARDVSDPADTTEQRIEWFAARLKSCGRLPISTTPEGSRTFLQSVTSTAVSDPTTACSPVAVWGIEAEGDEETEGALAFGGTRCFGR